MKKNCIPRSSLSWELLRSLFAKEDSRPIKSLASKPTALTKGDQSTHRFRTWAYGDKYVGYLLYECDAIDLMNAWNERHGDKLTIRQDELIHESEEKMRELYKEYLDGLHTDGSTPTTEIPNLTHGN